MLFCIVAQRLYAELSLLNLNLPARVFLPFPDLKPHYILRIPQAAAVVLNSKDRVSFFFYRILNLFYLSYTDIFS